MNAHQHWIISLHAGNERNDYSGFWDVTALKSDCIQDENTKQTTKETKLDPNKIQTSSQIKNKNTKQHEQQQYKQTKYKLKKLKEQVLNNTKAQRGFGYTYQEIKY